MRTPKTCVIGVSYRGAADAAACIRSLRQSTVPVEIVVVDTTPNDPALAPAIGSDPGTILLRAKENLGFGRANNLGIQWALQHSLCEFFFLLNNDTVVESASIETIERAMSAQPEVGIMVPRIAYLNDPDTLWYGGGEMDWRRASAFTPGFNGSSRQTEALAERDVTFATGCALFFRRSALKQLGGFDPRFFMYEEDVELCLRARDHGIRICYLPSAFILHRAQGSSNNSSQDRTEFWSTSNPQLPFLCYHVIRNRLLNIATHARGADLCVALFFFPLFLIRRALPFLLGGRFDAIAAMLRGFAGFFRAGRAVPVELWPREVAEKRPAQ